MKNEERIRGKSRIDLDVDPPPDLVTEVDITSPSLARFPIYARIGVREIRRHDGERGLSSYCGGEYAELAERTILPPISGPGLSRLIEESKTLGSAAWPRGVREWARNDIHPSG